MVEQHDIFHHLAEDDRVALNIKNDSTEQLARELAAITGENLTQTVTVAVRERLERVRRQDSQAVRQRQARILTLGRAIADALGPDGLEVEDLYEGDFGLPA